MTARRPGLSRPTPRTAARPAIQAFLDQQPEAPPQAIADLEARVAELEAENRRLMASAEAELERLGIDDGIEVTRVPLDQLRERPWDSDAISPQDIRNLWALIEQDGLQVPLILDRQYRCLSGECRRRALHLGRDQQPGRYNERFPHGVPCLITELDWDQDPTACDIAMLSMQRQRRRERGAALHGAIRRVHVGIRDDPRFSWGEGKPPRGQESGVRYLKNLFGCGLNTVRRAIQNERDHQAPDHVARRACSSRATALLERLQNLPEPYPGSAELQRVVGDFIDWCQGGVDVPD